MKTIEDDDVHLLIQSINFREPVLAATHVRLGEHDRSRDNDSGELELRIIMSIQHPKYEYPSQYNDIALFKLERQVTFSSAIRPACLPEQSEVLSEKAIATGWGAKAFQGMASNVLRKVTLEMFTQNECNGILGAISYKLHRGIIERTQVCAGSHNEQKDACQGDSGGYSSFTLNRFPFELTSYP